MRKFTITIFTVALLVLTCRIANAQYITVSWAGTSVAGNSSSGAPDYLTEINNPFDVCLDAQHNVYFVDQFNNVIRKISAKTGVCTIIAGGGTSTADGVPATSAVLSPCFISMDRSNNLYVTTGNQVRMIYATTGIITTIAGTGTAGYTGDGGAATAATLNDPQGMCLDAAGNIYIVDAANNVVRKVTAATGIITTIAGTGTAGYAGDGGAATAAELSQPNVICMNAAGDIFVADYNDGIGAHYIRKISASTGIITTIAGIGTGWASGDGGPAADASMGWLWGLACDASGNIFCCDVSCSCREIDATTGIINTVAGSDFTDGYDGDGYNALSLYFNWPHGLCVDAEGNIFIADTYNNRLRRVIHLTHTPSFAYGKGQTILPCPGQAVAFNDQMAITVLDTAQTETWTVISAPVNGTLTGFPYSALSNGNSSATTPTGMTYTSTTGYTGTDSFKVMVSNGSLSDTMTVYVSMIPSSPLSVTSPTSICTGAETGFVVSQPGGSFSLSNTNATIIDSAVTGNVQGLDTAIYTISGVCSAPAFAFSVNTSPDAGTISGDGIVCLGSAITLSETVSTGVWVSANSSASVDSITGIVAGSTTGTDTILYTVSNAYCTSTASWNLVVGIPVGSIASTSGVPPAGVCVTWTNEYYETTTGGTWSLTNSSATYYLSGSFVDIVGMTPGVDTLLYTVSNSCGTSSATYTIPVVALPNASISGTSSFCMNSVISFTSADSGGTWSTVYGYAAIDSTTPYSVALLGAAAGSDSVYYTVSNSLGCSVTTGTSVVVNPLPDAGTITGASVVFVGTTITLSETTGGGIWSTTNSTISTVSGAGYVYGVATGVDSVIYTVTSLGCTSSTYYTDTVYYDLGLNNISNVTADKLIISPNPATEELNINVVSSYDEQVTITITNIAGEKVKEFTGTTNKQMTEQMDVPAGVYYLNATSAHVNQGSKIVKE